MEARVLKRRDFENMLIGKTIDKIETFNYIRSGSFEEIHFTDGSMVECSGNADLATGNAIYEGGIQYVMEDDGFNLDDYAKRLERK